jgi:phosphoribosylformylglycinamidine synthase subunit PurS
VTFRAIIRPKEGILDPPGEATERALRQLGFDVRGVRLGRVAHLEVEAADEAEGRRQVEQMCARLLANPLIEVYEVERVDEA